MRGLAAVAAVALIAVPLSSSASRLADKPFALWYADGEVLAVAASDDAVYVGGSFSLVGLPTGSWVRVDASGKPVPARPFVEGSVAAAASDGSGGWFLLGKERLWIDGVRRTSLVHVTASGRLDTAWQPRIQGGSVAAIAVRGATVFLGGDFTRVNGKARMSLAAVNARSGALAPWAPRGGVKERVDKKLEQADVYDLALSPNGRTLYAVGDFELIGGKERSGAAALSTADASVGAWNPRPGAGAQELVVSPRGDVVYLSGYFSRAGGQRREGLAAVDTRRGRATAWRPVVDESAEISGMAPAGDVVYLAGDFESLGGRTRHGIGAVDARTGAVTSWEPAIDADDVTAVAVSADRSLVYVAGDFNVVDGERRDLLAALDARTGELVDWDPRGSGQISALIPGAGGSVWVGGDIGFVGGERRSGLAGFSADGSILAATASIQGVVRSLALSPDGARLYAGGAFGVNDVAARNLAVVDPRTLVATAWGGTPNSGVWALAPAADGRTLYMGGAFTTVAGQRRTRLAALDAVSGELLSWNSGANQVVRDLALDGASLYVAGDFSSIGGAARRGVARLDAAGAAQTWDARSSGNVHAVSVRDGLVVVGGTFNRIGGRTRNSLAALEEASGNATAWDPNPDEPTHALAFHPTAPRLLVAGDFRRIGGTARVLAEFTWPDGSLTAWNPAVGPEKTVAYSPSGRIVVVGGNGGFAAYR
jgi:Domain of unknown function (DUF5122) beta-propeller